MIFLQQYRRRGVADSPAGRSVSQAGQEDVHRASDIDMLIEKIVFIRIWLSLMDGLQRSCLIPGICVTVFLTGATYVQSSGVAGFFYVFLLSGAGRSPSVPCKTEPCPEPFRYGAFHVSIFF